MPTTITIESGDPSTSQAFDSRHYDANWRRIWAAANSHNNPSDRLPTDTHAQKSLAIAAYTQEMTLAGLLLSKTLGAQIEPAVLDTSRKALESIYAQAGLLEPQATRQAVENQLSERLLKYQNGPGL